MSPKSESGGTSKASQESVLRSDLATQLELYEADLKRHEDALIDLRRTETAIRGFAITAVAALVAAAYASGEKGLSLIAVFAAGYFAFLDYHSCRLDAEIRNRIEFLAELSKNYRKTFIGSRKRRQKRMFTLRTQLRSFDPFGAVPTKPVLWMWWRNRQARKQFEKRKKEAEAGGSTNVGVFKPTQAPGLGPFRQFCYLYAILAGIALLTALGGVSKTQERIILCQPPNEIAAMAEGVELEGCEAPSAPSKERKRKSVRKAGRDGG